ncbi:MAG: hypothetical protein M0R74_07645, partial [Dehalococcoidia bacterium]|nr:hypothetical protein [Dehalococcoidia bacterium]
SLEGVNVRGFIDACIRVTGPSTRLTRVTTDGCAVGIAVQGPGVTVTQSRVGLDAREGDAVMLAGVLVQASDVAIGSLEGDSSEGNTIGNVHTGVLFATVSGELAGGVVGGNRIGEDTGEAAPVEAGVRIEPRASGVQVIANDFSNITRAAIDVTDGDPPPIANRFAGNRYDLRGGMAIDLGSDGVRNENGPSDDGPNRLQNHPVITRPTQASIAGEVPGCGPGCIVELYRVRHEAGGGNDTPTIPLGTVITDADAGFTFEAPALVPGDWVMATATDLEGNTSEFGPSVRVGTGVVQCGNVSLKQGWNLVGYFGPGPLALNEAFPGENGARVRAVYQLVNGTETYTHWIAGTAVGRTLTTLHPGEAYWFLVDGPVTLPEGFSLGVGLPVTLLPGWNAFVYIGASGDPADALGELAAKYSTIYRWNNDGPVGAWERYAPLAPGYVNGVEEIRACDSYVILMDEAGVLTPLQP